MQHPEKNIKGFNILELLVVLAIIGVIAAVAYPNFSDWRSSRIVKDEVQRAKSLFQAITAQVKRGQYAYVQAQVFVEEDKITLTSKGDFFEKISLKTSTKFINIIACIFITNISPPPE